MHANLKYWKFAQELTSFQENNNAKRKNKGRGRQVQTNGTLYKPNVERNIAQSWVRVGEIRRQIFCKVMDGV